MKPASKEKILEHKKRIAEQSNLSKGCPFCPMFVGKDDDIIDIEPLNPVVPGHRIVIPKEHVENFTEDLFVTVAVMHYAVRLARKRKGDINLITSRGKNATQTVKHLHVHLVPREEGDGLHLPWTNQKPL